MGYGSITEENASPGEAQAAKPLAGHSQNAPQALVEDTQDRGDLDDKAVPSLDELIDQSRQGLVGNKDGHGYRSPWVTRSGKRIDLTFRQHRFVAEYLKDTNANAAARRAGYTQYRGVHNNPIYTPAVQEAILDEVAYQTDALKINSHRVLAELYQIAFMGPPEIAVYVKSGAKVSLKDKTEALALLMKFQNMFADHNKKEVTVTISDLVKESYTVKPRTATVGLAEPRTVSALPVVSDGDLVALTDTATDGGRE